MAAARQERESARAWTLWKLYVAPERGSQGIGVRLLDEYIARLPKDVTSVLLEHFAFNDGAGRSYEREGFAVERTTPRGARWHRHGVAAPAALISARRVTKWLSRHRCR